MSNYSTISVPGEVKRTLEQAKGDRDWGRFLLDLYAEAENAKRERAFVFGAMGIKHEEAAYFREEFEKLVESLSEEDLEAIAESIGEFRERFRIG